MSARLVAFAALSVALAGCADRGIFQLDVTLPEQQSVLTATGRPVVVRYAAVQLRTGRAEPTIFDAPWSNEETTPAVVLAVDGATQMRVDVEVGAGAADGPISAKLIFCGESSCGRDGAAPDVSEWLVFERAAYVGAVTRYELDRASAPVVSDRDAGPTVIGRCEIEGCNQGISVPSYCDDDRHFCEGT